MTEVLSPNEKPESTKKRKHLDRSKELEECKRKKSKKKVDVPESSKELSSHDLKDCKETLQSADSNSPITHNIYSTHGESTSSSVKKKKRSKDAKSGRNDEPLVNPSEDKELSDKARAALYHAYTRSITPETWKFNKAYQNWIIKNAISIDAIPEKYDHVLKEYLSGCQGKAKDILLQRCKQCLDGEDINTSSTPIRSSETDGNEDETGTVKREIETNTSIKSRAKLLYGVLSCDNSL